MLKRHVFLLLFAFALELTAAEWKYSHFRKPLRTNSYQNELKEKLKRMLLTIFPQQENLRPPSVSKQEHLLDYSSEENSDEYRTKSVNQLDLSSIFESQNAVTNFLKNVASSVNANAKRESLKLESKSHSPAPLRNTLYSTSEEDFFISEQESMGEVLKKMKQYFKLSDGANTEQFKQPISENDNRKEVFEDKNSSLHYKEGDKNNIFKGQEDWKTPIEDWKTPIEGSTYLLGNPKNASYSDIINSPSQPLKQEEQLLEQDEDVDDADDEQEDPETEEDSFDGKSVQKSSDVVHEIGEANVPQSKNTIQYLPIKTERKKSSSEEDGQFWLPQLRSKLWTVNPEERPFDKDERETEDENNRRSLEDKDKPPPILNLH